MNDDLSVVIDIRNKRMEQVGRQQLSFVDYTDMLCADLKRVITDIEDAFYDMQGGQEKDSWDLESQMHFAKIRHKLLDYANAVKRLPTTLRYKGISCNGVPASEFFTQGLLGADDK